MLNDKADNISKDIGDLQSTIEFGRVYYAQDPDAQRELDIAQAQVDETQRYVRGLKAALAKDSL